MEKLKLLLTIYILLLFVTFNVFLGVYLLVGLFIAKIVGGVLLLLVSGLTLYELFWGSK